MMSGNFDNNSSDSKNTHNSYSESYHQDQISALEENAPNLNAPIGRTVNKKAIFFIVLTCLSTIGLTIFAIQQLSSEEEHKAEQAQIVTVPDLPNDAPPVVEQPAASSPIPLEEAKPLAQNQPFTQDNNIDIIDTSAYQRPSIQPVQTIPQDVPLDKFDPQKENRPFVEEVNDVSVSKQAAMVRALPNRDKLLVQGTYLRCVLETKIVSDIPGFTSCIITETVYSANGKSALIPKGSKVMGQYGSSNPVSPRLGVIWDRIITPDGLDITLRSPGVDNLGAAGHPGDFRSHWQSRLASALLISMMSDAFKYAAAKHGPGSSVVTDGGATYTDPYESETADTLKQQAINQLERNSARPNTVTINQGTLINVYTAQDIDFNSVIQ